MRRTVLLQEIRKMRFEEAYDGWTESLSRFGFQSGQAGSSSQTKGREPSYP